MVTFVDIPSDILLEIVSNLNLHEVFCFLSTCFTIRKLTQSRYLWIGVLERTLDTRCLSCPLGEDLSKVDLQELQRIARHTYRLEQNWTRKTPRIMGPVRATRYEGDHSMIAVIPGTDLVFLHSTITSQLLCFDVQTMTRSASLRVHKPLFDKHYDEYGKHLMAFVSWQNSYNVLHVICTEYGHGRETTMRQIFQVVLGVHEEYINMIFVHADVVGLVTVHNSSVLSVRAHNMVTNVSVTIPIKPGESTEPLVPMSVHVLEGDLYIALRAGCQRFICHFCRDVLPYGESLGNANGQLILDNQAYHSARRLPDFVVARASRMGLTTVAMTYPVAFSDLVTTEMWFLPMTPGRAQGALTFESSTSEDGGVCLSLNVEVRRSGSRMLASSTQSGAYTVLLTDYTEDTGDVFTQLRLLHIIKDPPSIQIRPLELPFFIDLNDTQWIAVDDHRGVVFLSHIGGYIFSVPYAAA